MPKPLRVEGRRDVRLVTDVDQYLAKQVDAMAAAHQSTRAAVIRSALEQHVHGSEKTPRCSRKAQKKPDPILCLLKETLHR